MPDDFEDWMHDTYGTVELSDGTLWHWSEWTYSPEAMRKAYEAGQKSVALDELVRKGKLLDEIMAHYKVDPDEQ